MVAAHMDEVGFMLTQINDNGLFQVVPLGGWNPYVVSAQRFTLKQVKELSMYFFIYSATLVAWYEWSKTIRSL